MTNTRPLMRRETQNWRPSGADLEHVWAAAALTW